MDPLNMELIILALKSVFQPALNRKIKEVASKTVSNVEYKANLTGSGAIAQGNGARAAAATDGSIAIGGDVTGKVITGDNNVVTGREIVHGGKISGDQIKIGRKEEISDATTFQKIADSSSFVRNQLELSYSQAREQAYTWFRFSIIVAGLGFVLVGIGVIAVILGHLAKGVITAISSVVPNTVAALFFLQSKASNERIDAIQRKLSEAREVQTAVEIANSIESKKERDRLKAEIVRMVIGSSGESTKFSESG